MLAYRATVVVEMSCIGSAVQSVFASLDCSTIGACDLSSLRSFASIDNDKLHLFTVSYTTQVFLWFILDNGSLVNKDVLLRVRPGDETMATSDIEPLQCQ